MNLIPTNTRNGHFLADFDHLFNRFFNAAAPATDDGVQTEENDKSWSLRVDLPGFRKEELSLSLEDGNLHLRATTEDQDRPFRNEVRHDWTLGEDVDPQGIDAQLEHGVLEITLPKRESAQPLSKTIEVR